VSTENTTATYDRLLASIGRRADEIGPRPVVAHWPHVGSAYDGLVIVGQALYGWPDDFPASQFRSREGRAEALRVARARSTERADPLDWIATHPVRTSPFWSVSRIVAEALVPDGGAPWYARLAWVNLYPAAPEEPPGNPGGPLREAQDPLVGDLLRDIVEMLDARIVLALVGPYWWPAGSSPYFATLAEHPRPLLRSGRVDDRTWVVGWHPGGASRRGWGPKAYAEILIREVESLGSGPRGAP
jgi:hypothetical protein